MRTIGPKCWVPRSVGKSLLLLLMAVVSCLAQTNNMDNIPRQAISRSDAFSVVDSGESYLFSYSADITNVPFPGNIYKIFGFLRDLRYLLSLDANGRFPTFSLYLYDTVIGAYRLLTDDSVHNGVWSPAGSEVDSFSFDRAGPATDYRVTLLDSSFGATTQVAEGPIDPESLEWSPDSKELLYDSIVPQTLKYLHDQRFHYQLNRYELDKKFTVSVCLLRSLKADLRRGCQCRPIAVNALSMVSAKQVEGTLP